MKKFAGLGILAKRHCVKPLSFHFLKAYTSVKLIQHCLLKFAISCIEGTKLTRSCSR